MGERQHTTIGEMIFIAALVFLFVRMCSDDPACPPEAPDATPAAEVVTP